MVETVRVGMLEIGRGRPCVIAPLTASDRESLVRGASALQALPVDMAEWRVDMLDKAVDEAGTPQMDRILDTLAALRSVCRLPILATFRTADEGGARPISDGGYAELCDVLARSGKIELLDVEAFFRSGSSKDIIARAHGHGVPVVASNHDFHATPSSEEIVRRLTVMQDELCADILKIAVMPRRPLDVLTLLEATRRMADNAKRPLITMSMGPLGVVSRVAGQIFGSAATFGAAAAASAPGQLDVRELDTVLGILERASR
ncbi:type I 3-dehydroquinate dehydratase [uncultured Mailhella sp.]|uniref:type I 3-dehydroquinate dehydratase n=1 Tax=uncultured Mailhella sp. TaxID=1981031 RepID=UPI0026073662|nr:type I 3-dehydroquinate dehydratase [uncultured Mailhella sp.]